MVPDWPSIKDKPSTNMWVKETRRHIEESGLFSDATEKEYQCSKIYSADDYLRLLDTYSDHQKLEYRIRIDLYHQIRELIRIKFDGQARDPISLFYFFQGRIK